MIPVGKCPKCGEVVRRAKFEAIELGDPLRALAGTTHRGYTLLCPGCDTILGAGFDPIAIQADTVAQIFKGLKGK